jgi:hypothetical protein
MRGGDISNEVPQRIVVTLDCILSRRPAITRVLGIVRNTEEVEYDRVKLARFWRFAEKHEYRLELAGFGYTKKEMKEIEEDLDNLGTNPFNYVTAYRTYSDLVGELPYRPEVKNVIDIPDRSLAYGHWYMEIERV